MKIIALLCILFSVALVNAQDDVPSTPTAISESASTPAAQAADSAELANPFRQQDLELLVGNVQRPNAITWFDNHLYAVCNGDWTIYKIDDRSGDTITFVFGVRNGSSLIIEDTEAGFDLWIPDTDRGTLWKVDQGRLAPVSVNNQLVTPWGITRINEHSFLVTNAHAHSISEVSESGVANTILTDLRSPTGIASHGKRVYVANAGSARRGIEWFEIQEDGSYSELRPLVSGLRSITNVVMANDGFLYFGYALGTRGIVGRIQPHQCLDEGCTSDDVEVVIFSDVPAPLALTLSEDMRLFMHSRYRPEIYWVQLPSSAISAS